MQTILGAGGAIGTPLAKELKNYTDKVRLVGRHPKEVNSGDELFTADITKADEVLKAVEGSEVVYLTVGLEYKIEVWREKWPVIMKNVIDACEKTGAKLVFFDNIYMYDPNHLYNMTEETPINPSSKKGKVRAQIAEMFMNAVKQGRIVGLIARSADFYGPGGKNSVLQETVFKNLQKGKKPTWLGDATKKHNYTYTPDAAKATALLGNTSDAYGRVWHLPTADPRTGEEWIALFAKLMNKPDKFTAVPKWMIKLMGIFVPVMGEMAEMVYQYDRDYVFSSDAFEKRFNLHPTDTETAVKEIIAAG